MEEPEKWWHLPCQMADHYTICSDRYHPCPIVANQELVTEASTGVTYWEGAVTGSGTSRGTAVTVEGYAELTGYAGSLGGVF